MLQDVFVGLCPAFGSHKLLASCTLKQGSAPLDGVGHAFGREVDDFVLDQTGIAATYSLDTPTLVNGRSGDGPYACVHSRRVSPGSQDAYGLYFFHTEKV